MVKMPAVKTITVYSTYLQSNINNVLMIVAILIITYNAEGAIMLIGPVINTILHSLLTKN